MFDALTTATVNQAPTQCTIHRMHIIIQVVDVPQLS